MSFDAQNKLLAQNLVDRQEPNTIQPFFLDEHDRALATSSPILAMREDFQIQVVNDLEPE